MFDESKSNRLGVGPDGNKILSCLVLVLEAGVYQSTNCKLHMRASIKSLSCMDFKV